MPDDDDLLHAIHRELGELHGTVRTMNEAVTKRIDRHETALYGNGVPGVVTRIKSAEDKLVELQGTDADARSAKKSAKLSLSSTALAIVTLLVAGALQALGFRVDGQLPPPVPPRPQKHDHDKQEPQGNVQPEVDAVPHGDPRGKAVGAIGKTTPPDGAKHVPIPIVIDRPPA